MSSWTRDDVAQAGIALADIGGIDAVTMRSVAARLGTAGASLYRIVDSHEQVLELMADAVIGEFVFEPAPPGSGSAGMLALATQAREIYARHPWMLALPSSSPILGPNATVYLDRALGALEGSGLSMRERLEAVGVISGFVRVLAIEDARSDQGKLSPQWQQALTSHLRATVADGTHPYLAAALLDAPAAPAPAGDRFSALVLLVIESVVGVGQVD